MSHPFFDVGTFPFDNLLGRELHTSLSQVITNPEAIELRCQKCLSSIHLNKSAAPSELWAEALKRLAAALKIRQLCDGLLADPEVASIHSIVKRVVDAALNNSIKREDKGEIGEDSILALIGLIRQHSDPRVLSRARIAHALLRNSLMPDVQGFDPTPHPIATIIRSLINDPVATSGTTPPAIRFCVLLSELCSSFSDRAISDALWQWFEQHCVPAGYNYQAVLGELPDFPGESSRFLWLDVHWREKSPGDKENTAYAYLRCGHLQYHIRDERSQLREEAQFAKLVLAYSAEQESICPVNHVSAVTQRSKMLGSWESESSTNALLPLPVTVRDEITRGNLKCPSKLDADTNADWTSEDSLSLATQTRGVFVTGKLPAAQDFPCQIFQALLNCAAVGIWTRGQRETDENDLSLRDYTHVNDLFDLPTLIHRRRKGAPHLNSIWRRVVLYFNPNIPPLIRDSDGMSNILQVNKQLT